MLLMLRGKVVYCLNIANAQGQGIVYSLNVANAQGQGIVYCLNVANAQGQGIVYCLNVANAQGQGIVYCALSWHVYFSSGYLDSATQGSLHAHMYSIHLTSGPSSGDSSCL